MKFTLPIAMVAVLATGINVAAQGAACTSQIEVPPSQVTGFALAVFQQLLALFGLGVAAGTNTQIVIGVGCTPAAINA